MKKVKKLTAMVMSAAVMAATFVSQPIPVSAEEIVISDIAASGICKGADNNLYLTDIDKHVICLESEGEIKIAAGQSGTAGYQDGQASQALFSSPWDVVAYNKGIAISDTENHAIRLLKNGRVTTLAGKGVAGWTDRKGKKASFCRPTGLAVGKKGELYIADTGNNCIRVMKKNGMVSTYAGDKKGCAGGSLKKARFKEPTGLFYKSGVLYVADSGNHRICQIKNGKVKTIAGSSKGIEGDVTGKAGKSKLSFPQNVYYANGALYIADTGNSSVKKLKSDTVTNQVEAYSMQDGLLPSAPRGIYIEKGSIYLGDIYSDQLIKIKM